MAAALRRTTWTTAPEVLEWTVPKVDRLQLVIVQMSASLPPLQPASQSVTASSSLRTNATARAAASHRGGSGGGAGGGGGGGTHRAPASLRGKGPKASSPPTPKAAASQSH